MMRVCEKHNRWVDIIRADGSHAKRDCPECPRPKQPRKWMHLPTGRIIHPAIAPKQDD